MVGRGAAGRERRRQSRLFLQEAVLAPTRYRLQCARHARHRKFLLCVLAVAAVIAVVILLQQEQPAQRGKQRPRIGPASIYPETARTPGFANPEITQANLTETICKHEWSTSEIRPASSYTSRVKRQQMIDWGLDGSAGDYEEDHLISLELGGHPTDPRNLWPEPYFPKPGAREKDIVENFLRRQVCAGEITLPDAQSAIVTDWYAIFL